MQSRNHELAHLYQVITLPYCQYFWFYRTELVRLEAAVMLKHFENGGSYIFGEHEYLLDIVERGDFSEFSSPINECLSNLRSCIADFYNNEKGFSLLDLIEGMAHVISLFLSDTPDVDYLGIEVSQKYTVAFDYFNSKLLDANLELRWKQLLFLYYCYFSFQTYPNNGFESNKPVDMFIFLCEKIDSHIEVLKNNKRKYSSKPGHDLNPAIDTEGLSHANQEQRSSILSFFDLIDVIEAEAREKFEFSASLDHPKIRSLLSWSEQGGILWENKYTLANMLIFPSNYQWIESLYEYLMREEGDENAHSNEVEFYNFIMQCRKLINPMEDVYCCSVHHYTNKPSVILNCGTRGGLSYFLKGLTERNSIDLFLYE